MIISYNITPSRLFLCSLFLCGLINAAEIHVPADFPTIQEGLAAAGTGDSVIVAPGTYQESVIWPAVDGIRLAGEDPDATVIHGDGSSRCLLCTPPVSISVHLEKMIFENGGILLSGFYGGSVLIENADSVIEDCSFRNSESGMGSLAVRNGYHDIRGCRFSGNTASPMTGGTGGAGLYAAGAGIISDCRFTGNTIMYGDGSGAFVEGGFVVERCVFEANQLEMSDASGGALATGYGSILVQNCTFTNNYGPASALLISGSSDIVNNLFVENDCEDENFGGTIMVAASADIRFNTFAGNSNASLFFLSANYDVEVHHNILDIPVDYRDDAEARSVTFHHNDYWPAALPETPGEGEFRESPQFVQGILGDYYLSQISAGQPGTSPCVDAGATGMTPPDGTTATSEIPDTGLPDIGYHYAFSGHPTPTATPVPEPTATPTGCTEPGVLIEMPANLYHAGDICWCNVTICNPDPVAYEDIPLFVVLEILGNYYFAPQWNSFDYYTVAVQPGFSIREVIPAFTWPSGAGVMEQATWYSAMVNPEMTGLFGRMDTWTFGWN